MRLPRPPSRRLSPLVAVCAALAAVPAAAVEPGTASVEVRVLDSGGATVVGARLSATSPAGSARHADTEGARASVRFASLPSGPWTLRVDVDGFAPAEHRLALDPGEVVQLEAVLERDGESGASTLRVLRRYRLSTGTPIGPGRLHELPSSRNIWSLLETFEPIAMVDRQDNGGLFAGEPGRVFAHGSSWTQTSFRMAGLDVTDPDRTGTPLLAAPYDAFEAMDLTTAVMPVETGGPGPLLTLQPRRPAARWGGSLQGNAISDGLQVENTRDGVPSLARFDSWWDASAVVSGPLVANRLGLLVAGSFTRSQRRERDRDAILEGETGGGLAHLVFTPGAGEELRLLAGHQRAEYPFPGRARFVGDPDQRETFSHVQATWERNPESGAAWSLSAGWLRGRFEPRLAGAQPRAVERVVDGPVRELVLPADSTRQRLQLEARYRPDLRGFDGGRHAMRFGASFSRNGSDTRPASDRLPLPELVDGRPTRVWEYGWAGPESRWRSTELAAWAADRIALGERLGVEAGLRFDLVDGSSDAAEGISWGSLSPRLSFRWDVLRGGRAVFFGGYARYRHRLLLGALAYGDPTGPQGEVYRWRDRNGDGAFQAGERGVLVARTGPGGAGIASIDPGLKRPHTDEFVLGLEGELLWGVTMRFTAVARRERNLIESVNVGVPPSSYDVFFVEDPSGDIDSPVDDQLLPIYDRRPESFGLDRFLLTNPGADHSSRHEGVEVLFEKRWEDVAWLMVGATAHRSEGTAGNLGFRPLENDQGVVGELFDQPNADTYARGRLFSDRAYSINIAAGARLPWDVRATGVARYQDGQPFARLVVADTLNQGAELVRGVPNGRHRFTFALTVDVRLEKGFQVGSARLAAVAEAFNLLNNSNAVEENPIDGALFRTETALQPPRAVRLGVRLDF